MRHGRIGFHDDLDAEPGGQILNAALPCLRRTIALLAQGFTDGLLRFLVAQGAGGDLAGLILKVGQDDAGFHPGHEKGALGVVVGDHLHLGGGHHR